MTKYIISLLLAPGLVYGAAMPQNNKDDEALAKLMNSLFLQVPIIRRNVTPEPVTVHYRRLAPVPEVIETNEPIVIRLTDAVHPNLLHKAGAAIIERKKLKINTLVKK